ncbi:MAG: hypothetical protein EBS19_00115 [Spirochaetia bacterium]|nr:hypothetical protein [Spirochaetia bacterium]
MLFGEELIQQGLINEKQLEEGLEYQKKNPTKKLGEIMIELGFINIDQMLSVVKKQLNDNGIP